MLRVIPAKIKDLLEANFLLSCKPFIKKISTLYKKVSNLKKNKGHEKPPQILELLLKLNK